MTAADRASEPDTRAELDQLIVSANEGELTHQQIARLKELLDSDEEAGLYYVAVMYVQAGLWRYFGNNSVSPRPACCDLADTDAECRDFGSAAPHRSSRSATACKGYGLFRLGLAGGVSGGNGDFRDRAFDRLPRVCVPARADCQAIRTPLYLRERGRG